MKIAIILPKLVNQGPILVAKEIVHYIVDKVEVVDVFYFDESDEIMFECRCTKISFWEPIDFDSYDVIHSHMLRPDIYLWFHKNKIKKAKLISTLHQNIKQNLTASYNGLIANIFELIWLKALSIQNVVVTLTETMKKDYLNKLTKPLLSTIYNGRSLHTLNNLPDPMDLKLINEIGQKFRIIGVSALLTKRKGISQLIKALPLLNDYALIIVGDGKEKINLVNLSNELGVADRCLFLGYKIDAFRFLPFYHIFAMSSYSEGFPLGLLEAGQKKIPVLCSDIELFRELFMEDQVSFFELDNPESIVSAIENIELNYHKYAENICEVINEKYSSNAMCIQYLNLYRQISKN